MTTTETQTLTEYATQIANGAKARNQSAATAVAIAMAGLIDAGFGVPVRDARPVVRAAVVAAYGLEEVA